MTTRRWLVTLGAIFLVAGLIFTLLQPVDADVFVGDAGSSEDPVITKSYSDQQDGLIKQYIDQKISSLDQNSSSDETTMQWETVQLQENQVLEAFAGTELIVRSGRVLAVAAKDGITDVTAGQDLANGASVSKNHHLIIPRSDGRGLQAQVKSWVMYKGTIELYDTKNSDPL